MSNSFIKPGAEESPNLLNTVAAAARDSSSEISSLASSSAEIAPAATAAASPEVDLSRHPSGIVPVLQ